jgi:hypothetical protein
MTSVVSNIFIEYFIITTYSSSKLMKGNYRLQDSSIAKPNCNCFKISNAEKLQSTRSHLLRNFYNPNPYSHFIDQMINPEIENDMEQLT